MIRRPPRSTRTDTGFPYTTRFRSAMVGSHTALVQAGIPSDLYSFPDEDHIKWQPAHRLAVYERNLAWFNFWLKNEMPTDPAQLDEAGRWKAMKDNWPRKPTADEPR